MARTRRFTFGIPRGKSRYTEGVPVLSGGTRVWVNYDDQVPDDKDFEHIGAAFEAAGLEQSGPVGLGIGRLCRHRALVDFGTNWMCQHRA